jgi:hypothetical protein
MLQSLKNITSLKLLIIAVIISVLTFFIEKPFPTIFIFSRLLVFGMVFYAIIKFLNKKF